MNSTTYIDVLRSKRFDVLKFQSKSQVIKFMTVSQLTSVIAAALSILLLEILMRAKDSCSGIGAECVRFPNFTAIE